MATSILSLDVGERRVGVATASLIARLPRPLTTLNNSPAIWEEVAQIAQDEDASTIVVGLPRNLSGEDTDQTRYVRDFAEHLSGFDVIFQDEALTSQKAEKELASRGKPFEKGDIDALAATYILEDYLATHEVKA